MLDLYPKCQIDIYLHVIQVSLLVHSASQQTWTALPDPRPFVRVDMMLPGGWGQIASLHQCCQPRTD